MQKRNFPRRRLTTEAFFRTDEGSVACTTENISVGGLYVRTEKNMAIGDKTEITIPLPTSDRECKVVVSGTAIRVEDGGVAFRFNNVDHKTFCDLLSYIYLPAV